MTHSLGFNLSIGRHSDPWESLLQIAEITLIIYVHDSNEIQAGRTQAAKQLADKPNHVNSARYAR